MKPYLLIWSADPYEQYVDEFDSAAERNAKYHRIKAEVLYAVCADVVQQTTGARESALTAEDQ